MPVVKPFEVTVFLNEVNRGEKPSAVTQLSDFMNGIARGDVNGAAYKAEILWLDSRRWRSEGGYIYETLRAVVQFTSLD